MEWLKDCKDALVAMAEIYGLVQILDLQTGKVYAVKSDRSWEQVTSMENNLQEQLRALLATATVLGSHQEVVEFINLSTLANRLYGQNESLWWCRFWIRGGIGWNLSAWGMKKRFRG